MQHIKYKTVNDTMVVTQVLLAVALLDTSGIFPPLAYSPQLPYFMNFLSKQESLQDISCLEFV